MRMGERSLDLDAIVNEVCAAVRGHIGDGKVADYIPALARVPIRKFGLAIAGVDGSLHVGGDADEAFSVQSISKVFTLTLALNSAGDALWRRVGREPSGSPFNSIVQLENEAGIPRNPFINAGAIVVSDILLGRDKSADGERSDAVIADILEFLQKRAGDDAVRIDAEVAASEAATGFRNVSLANFMKGYGNIDNAVSETLKVYFSQCAIAMSCRHLAQAGLFLAAGGRDPASGEGVVERRRARRINALMLSCGHYDASGDFAFRVGLPGKSGVGGGILAIAPNKASIAVWSPGLNANGNSLVGALALEHLARKTGWSVF